MTLLGGLQHTYNNDKSSSNCHLASKIVSDLSLHDYYLGYPVSLPCYILLYPVISCYFLLFPINSYIFLLGFDLGLSTEYRVQSTYLVHISYRSGDGESVPWS